MARRARAPPRGAGATPTPPAGRARRPRTRSPREARRPARRLGSPADELRIVPGARRVPASGDVDRLEDVRLAGAVPPDERRDAGGELEIDAGVAPEVVQQQLRDTHVSSLRAPGRAM